MPNTLYYRPSSYLHMILQSRIRRGVGHFGLAVNATLDRHIYLALSTSTPSGATNQI